MARSGSIAASGCCHPADCHRSELGALEGQRDSQLHASWSPVAGPELASKPSEGSLASLDLARSLQLRRSIVALLLRFEPIKHLTYPICYLHSLWKEWIFIFWREWRGVEGMEGVEGSDSLQNCKRRKRCTLNHTLHFASLPSISRPTLHHAPLPPGIVPPERSLDPPPRPCGIPPKAGMAQPRSKFSAIGMIGKRRRSRWRSCP